LADKTINLKPYHVEWKPEAEGFLLEFGCETEGDKRITVKLHFRFWWIGFLARELWKAIAYRERETAEAKKAMTS
jgi:hypothetical protein